MTRLCLNKILQTGSSWADKIADSVVPTVHFDYSVTNTEKPKVCSPSAASRERELRCRSRWGQSDEASASVNIQTSLWLGRGRGWNKNGNLFTFISSCGLWSAILGGTMWKFGFELICVDMLRVNIEWSRSGWIFIWFYILEIHVIYAVLSSVLQLLSCNKWCLIHNDVKLFEDFFY